jgi:uncharacterized protein YjbI with pentapeptide repeats
MGFSYDARLFAIHFGAMITGDVGSLEIGDMDRVEALRLLRAGKDGIDEWNQRREAEEAVPDLTHAVLRGADLSGADLSGANLAKAEISGAALRSANLMHLERKRAKRV